MNNTLYSAITTKHLVAFQYHGCLRICEPHVYGILRQQEELLAYQIGGQSNSGPLPEYRRVKLAEVGNLTILPETFPGPRPTPSGRHSSWDAIYALVR